MCWFLSSSLLIKSNKLQVFTSLESQQQSLRKESIVSVTELLLGGHFINVKKKGSESEIGIHYIGHKFAKV